MDIRYPQTVEEAVDLFKEAVAARRPLVPAGGLTRLKADPAVQTEDALILSVRRLTEFRPEPGNLLAGAQAGLTPNEVDRALAGTGLYWPVSGLGGRTLGAIMAEGALGLETMARGSMIDWILGTSIIVPDGRLVHSGGRTLKNVSGYDFTRLAWRAHGRLGLSVSFILKLLPRPAAAPVLAVETAGPGEAAALSREIITRRLAPEALRIAWSPQGTTLLIWLTGFPELVADKEAALKSLIGGRSFSRHEDGFTHLAEYRRFWPADDPGLVGLMGSRHSILDLARRLEETHPPLALRADLDVGGGRAVLEPVEGHDADGLSADVPGLVPDRYQAAGLVFERLKKELDPDRLIFPDRPAGAN